MIKAFISHSSVQKEFVKELVEILGRDYCIVDCYNFESAYRTLDEIYKRIEQSTVFVLLISRESLASDWVEEEIQYVRKKLNKDKVDRFWPYIIDETLSIEDCPEWMKKDESFNLVKFKSPKILANDIERKFRKIIWSNDEQRKQLDTSLVGRNADIDKFEKLYLSALGMHLKAIVVSGRGGVGKDMFISKCMDKIGYSMETTPFLISMGNKEGIENFIIYLNLITHTYNETELEDILLSEIGTKSKTAASLVNEILKYRTVITIEDDMSCVQPNKKLAQWIVDIVEKSEMNNQLGIFIKSCISLNSFECSEHPSFGNIDLKPLDANDRRMLFYHLLRNYGLQGISEDDVNFFVEKLLHSPYQLVKAAEALSKNPVRIVKRDISTLTSWGDKQIKPMISHFFADEEKRQLLIILSKMDFVSYDVLESFFEDRIMEVMEIIDEMITYGIVTIFGPNEEFFRLDHYFSDYIKRCRLELPKHLEDLLNEILEKKITTSSDITENVSLYLYEKKCQIMAGKGDVKDYLIPSVVMTSVIEIYNKQNYEQVIKTCDTVLNDIHNYYPEQERELRYWLCLSLARTTNNRFYEEIKYFNKDVDYYFLRGFYHRNALEYNSAERYFAIALKKSPNLQRAKREMVTSLLAQKKYDKALKMAKENYENCPENSYQIHGYFRCLVRKANFDKDDIDMLSTLMESMKENLSDKHEELYAAMNIEYQDCVKHLAPSEMIKLIRDAELQFPKSINVERAAQPFRIRQALITKEEILPEDHSCS